jgi:hypothetical protein
MPRNSAARTIDAIIRDAVDGVVERAVRSIREAISAQVAAELKAAPRARRGGPAGRRPRRPARKEIVRWVADNRARRVPNFVIEATGLDTKRKIVARFGPNAAFEVGKPLPAVAKANGPAGEAAPKTPPKPRPPVVRRKAAAAAK